MTQNFLHKDREAIRTPIVHVRKRRQHYGTNLIDAILSLMSDFKAEQRISTIDFHRYKTDLVLHFRIIHNTKFSEIRRFN